MFLDLHVHTTASDGTFEPSEILKKAKEENLDVIAITDHDTIEGIEKVQSTQDILFIPGIEISAEFGSTLHILGYAIDVENEYLQRTLDNLQEYRLHRNERMIKKMNEKGFHLTIDELKEVAKGELIGRPHFARLMFQKGYVSSYQEAFDRYLKKGALFYMDKKRLSPRESIELIIKAGGIAVMAHPYQTGLEGEELEKLLKTLVDYGLMGVEVFYSQHSANQIEEYFGLAKKYDLLVTAGSDFHGENKPHISLGMNVRYIYLKDFLYEVHKRMERRVKNEASEYSR